MAFLIVTFIATIAVIVAVILLIMQSAELNKSIKDIKDMEDDISRACILLADEIAEAERHITELEEVKK